MVVSNQILNFFRRIFILLHPFRFVVLTPIHGYGAWYHERGALPVPTAYSSNLSPSRTLRFWSRIGTGARPVLCAGSIPLCDSRVRCDLMAVVAIREVNSLSYREAWACESGMPSLATGPTR